MEGSIDVGSKSILRRKHHNQIVDAFFSDGNESLRMADRRSGFSVEVNFLDCLFDDVIDDHPSTKKPIGDKQKNAVQKDKDIL